jgi:hypothetical protein
MSVYRATFAVTALVQRNSAHSVVGCVSNIEISGGIDGYAFRRVKFCTYCFSTISGISRRAISGYRVNDTRRSNLAHSIVSSVSDEYVTH